MGLCVIGRPNNTGGVEELALLLNGNPSIRYIIVVGDFDPKHTGDWPGLRGCRETAEKLSARLNRPVSWVLPPTGCKDVRCWVNNLHLPLDCSDSWSEAGEQLSLDLMNRKKTVVGPQGDATNGQCLSTTRLDSIQPQPVRYLIPERLPVGKLVLAAGEGGQGKSTITLGVTADLTAGRPCFGLTYDAPPPCDVLLISCEDDFADTIVPRLLAAGADLARIHRVDGIKDDKGKIQPFNLSHYQQIEAKLEQNPAIRFVVIDPAGAFIGRSGIDDYKDSELRALLGPLSDLAARRQVTILLVKHFIKGATAKAVHKVGGSTGYVNAVRAAYVVVPSKDDEEIKLLLPIKFNIGPKPSGLSFRTETLSDEESKRIIEEYAGHLDESDQEQLARQLFRIRWLGFTDADADDVLADQARKSGGGNKVKDAEAWLLNFLDEFAYPSEEIFEAGKNAGFTKDNFYRAKKNLGDEIKARSRGFQEEWWWGRGDPSKWKDRPIPWSQTPNTPNIPNIQNLPNIGGETPFD
jgi:hypothetical protein